MALLELKVATGPKAGKAFVIQRGEMVFGRTKGDVVIDWDGSTSSRHFKIVSHQDQFVIHDLGSTHGTYVNGNRVTASPLADGDKVIAGSTIFLVHLSVPSITDSVANFNPFAEVAVGKSSSKSTVVEPTPAPRRTLSATQSTCSSGILRVCGELSDENSLPQLFKELNQRGSFFLLIDFARLTLPAPKSIDIDASKLFSWMPNIAAAQSPLLVSLNDLPEWSSYIEDAWGNDALMALQSKLPAEALLAKLRERLSDASRGPEAARGILGFCWPSVLESLLTNDQHGFVGRFFENIAAVLMESSESEKSWQAFCTEESLEILKSVGVDILPSQSNPLKT